MNKMLNKIYNFLIKQNNLVLQIYKFKINQFNKIQIFNKKDRLYKKTLNKNWKIKI